MGKAREVQLRRRVDWLTDSLDEMREHWTNKQLECEILRGMLEEKDREIAVLRAELDAVLSGN